MNAINNKHFSDGMKKWLTKVNQIELNLLNSGQMICDSCHSSIAIVSYQSNLQITNRIFLCENCNT